MSATYRCLFKWLVLSIAIGVIAGLGAVAFLLALRYTTNFLLGYLAGYDIPTPVSEGGDPGSAGFPRPWAVPLITTIGALLSALVVARFAPEAAGPGTDDAIETVHTDPRAIHARVVLVKFVASALTIGSGGSGGREGPVAQISAGFGALLTRRLRLSDADGRLAVALAIGSGVGAIFNTPLGGAVLAASVIYRRDIDYRSLIPGFIASAVAYALRGAILGFEPMFGFMAAEFRLHSAWALLWFVLLGVVAAAVGYLYARALHGTEAVTGRLPGGPILKPAVGGLLVGSLGLVFPQILCSGYGWIQLVASREALSAIPLWIIVALPMAKIVATALSVGTGGSGGLFGPGVVTGAFVGAAIWRLGDLLGLPGVPDGPSFFVMAAMVACFGSVAHVPLALVIMVAEMTGSFAVLPGAIIAAGAAALLLSGSPVTMYRTQRLDRWAAEAERAGATATRRGQPR